MLKKGERRIKRLEMYVWFTVNQSVSGVDNAFNLK